MFALTKEERQAILFLLAVAFIGLSINLTVKLNSHLEKIVKVDVNIAKIDINTANLDELLRSKSITKKLAQDIIQYRYLHGAFRDLEELKEIKGIGEKRYEKLKEILFVK